MTSKRKAPGSATKRSAGSKKTRNTPKRGDSERASEFAVRYDTGSIPRGTTVIVVDEFGEWGNGPNKKHRHFGYAVAVTDRPVEYARITDGVRKRVKGEPKAYLCAGYRDGICTRIGEMGVDCGTYYVDKESPPQGWTNKNATKDMKGLVRHSLEDAVPKEGRVLVVVDYHSSLKNIDDVLDCLKKVNPKVAGGVYNSTSGQFSDILQTHDYVAYATGGAVEYEERTLTDKIGMKFRKITERLGHDNRSKN